MRAKERTIRAAIQRSEDRLRRIRKGTLHKIEERFYSRTGAYALEKVCYMKLEELLDAEG